MTVLTFQPRSQVTKRLLPNHTLQVIIDLEGEIGPDHARLRDGQPIRAWYKLIHKNSKDAASTDPNDLAYTSPDKYGDGEIELVLRWRYNPLLDPEPKPKAATGSIRWGRDIDGKMSPRDDAVAGGRSVASTNTIASGGSATLGEMRICRNVPIRVGMLRL